MLPAANETTATRDEEAGPFGEVADQALGGWNERRRAAGRCRGEGPTHERLLAYATGNLVGAELVEIRRHLHDCSDCFGSVREILRQQTVALATPARPALVPARPPSRSKLITSFVRAFTANAMTSCDPKHANFDEGRSGRAVASAAARLHQALDAVKRSRWESAMREVDGLLRSSVRSGTIDSAQVHGTRGVCQLGAGDLVAARKSFEKAVSTGGRAEAGAYQTGLALTRWLDSRKGGSAEASRLAERIARLAERARKKAKKAAKTGRRGAGR